MARRDRRKSLRIKPETYERLKSFMKPYESFDQAISRLLDTVLELEERVRSLEEGRREELRRLAEEAVRRAVDAVELDKAAWYIVKTVFSVQALKDTVDMAGSQVLVDQQLNRVLRNLQQLRERYGVDVRTAAEIYYQYVNEPTKENRILVNEATKELIKSILVKILSLQIVR